MAIQKKPKFKVEPLPPGEISYSQVDTTERFGDDVKLGPDEWISTIPLNSITQNYESMGLPPVNADVKEGFGSASRLSHLRESISIYDDGVYCAVCHIANIDITKLRKPCPQCGRALFKFGWD